MGKLINKNGHLASIDEAGVKIIVGATNNNMVLAREGIVHYVSKEKVRQILIRGGETEDLDEIEDEYHLIVTLESYLYQWFMENKFDEELMQVIYKDFIDETLLNIQVKMLNKIWNYDYKIMLDNTGNVTIKEELILDKDCFNRVFRIGKYERKVEDLKRYEKGFIRV